MHPFPHRYHVAARAVPEGEVVVSSDGLEPIATLPPVEFDGPGDRWSPETLLLAALVDCYSLTFRAIARKSRLAWEALDVTVEGLLEREGGNSRFTRFDLAARLQLAPGADRAAAEQALHRAEAGCLIANSLAGERHLAVRIEGGGAQ
jgi:organic hydroperoxide reductase OsmC/OhrA